MSTSHGAAAKFGAAALADALRDARDDGERLLLVREFIRGAQDDASSPADVDALVAGRPGRPATAGGTRSSPGVAEWVADRLGSRPAPAWVDEPSGFLDRWFQAEQTRFGRAGAVANAPAAFRRRGVLVDPAGLVSDGVAL